VKAHVSAETDDAGREDVTASELATFSYCAKAWHLERVLGAQPSADVLRNRGAGIDRHARHGSGVRMGTRLGGHSRAAIAGLLALAALLATLALLIK
jgi:hypothetical protein